ncbi:MAG: helix-turn-helix domain-containing protein [Deltaproteobacteria bacterium]|nr:helix-turn-helix domain-containing protein [Deltaproteobacteria bacterium]
MEGNTISAIRARRLLLGKRLDDVAGPAGISSPFLSRLERGQRGVSANVLRRLAATLDLPPEMLFTDDAEAGR